jgi:hypothetical protein
MNDLISRQALCEYALNQKDKSVTPNDIMRFPSTQPEPCEDFVKVVRCKKCRYVHCDKEFDNYWCNRMSGAFMVEAEGFCKWGR